MRSKLPKAVKIFLTVVCAGALVSAICNLAPELVFIKSFLGYAKGLDHKAIVLAEPVVKIASTLVCGVILMVLVVALALGKSWARKSCIVMAIVRLGGTAFAVVSLSAVFCLAQFLPNLDCWSVVSQSLNKLRWWNGIEVAVDALLAVFALSVFFRHAVVAWYREDATLENKWKNRIQCLTFWVLMIAVGLVCGMVQGVAGKLANPRKLADKFPRLRVAELKARADLGDAPSMWRLGNWERNGWLGEKHPDKALAWYRKAADRGNRFALNDLGDCYEKGIGTETNLEEAVACWMKAAEKKHGWAACKVAIRYQKDKKPKEAFEWFQKSADIGSDYGCCKLGECYEKGWGTETNAVLAAEWFLKGAERRHSWGMEKTGDFYRDGYGVAKDLDKAREWYKKAVSRGNKNAKKKLDALPVDTQADKSGK